MILDVMTKKHYVGEHLVAQYTPIRVEADQSYSHELDQRRGSKPRDCRSQYSDVRP